MKKTVFDTTAILMFLLASMFLPPIPATVVLIGIPLVYLFLPTKTMKKEIPLQIKKNARSEK